MYLWFNYMSVAYFRLYSSYGLDTGASVFDARQDTRDLFLHYSAQTSSGVHPPHIQWASAAVFQGAKQSGRKAYPLSASCVEQYFISPTCSWPAARPRLQSHWIYNIQLTFSIFFLFPLFRFLCHSHPTFISPFLLPHSSQLFSFILFSLLPCNLIPHAAQN
jgi:hypothetical protein